MQYTFFTAPDGPGGVKSINSPHDALVSAKHCFPFVRERLFAAEGGGDECAFDAVLVACYSPHPLVGMVRAELRRRGRGEVRVLGIMEGSFAAGVAGLWDDTEEKEPQRFGIVSTGKVWEGVLARAVAAWAGYPPRPSPPLASGEDDDDDDERWRGYAYGRFAGVETTGVDATDLHDLPRSEVEAKMREATRRLLRRGNVGAVCLGCAGMVGLENVVRSACVEELGDEVGSEVRIVDGVKAGVAALVGMVRGGF